MTTLPDPNTQQPNAIEAGQPTLDDAARKFLADIEEALANGAAPTPTVPTSYRDNSPIPLVGTTPPVPQPGVPPMSHRTTEIMRAVMYGSVATVPPGLIAVAIMVASEHADPTVMGMICAAPAALAVPILALSRLLRRAKETVEAAPPVVHQHYTGTVIQDQRNIHSNTRGVWAKTHNQLPG